MKKSEAKKINNALDWVRAALDCKRWEWDGDQRECAELELDEARTILARYVDLPNPSQSNDTQEEC